MVDQDPITDHAQIIEQLREVESGDELTVVDESGYRDNRTVRDVENCLIQFGDPTGPGRVLKAIEGTCHRLTADPDHPLSPGMKITKLWVWR